MLKYVDTKICFQEVPDEISLCISLSGCPSRCKGCHSPYLQEDIGTELTLPVLDNLIKSNKGITCVCFMGGDNDIPALHELSKYVKEYYDLKTAWYSGLSFKPYIDRPSVQYFDYVKTGPYIELCGPLTSKLTNQRFYKKEEGSIIQFKDITYRFWKDD